MAWGCETLKGRQRQTGRWQNTQANEEDEATNQGSHLTNGTDTNHHWTYGAAVRDSVETTRAAGRARRPVSDDDVEILKRYAYGTTVKVLPPGPASLENGPQPASEPAAQVAPAGQARAMAV